MPRQMNQSQRAFAEAYAKCGNATSSALQAGYSEKTAPQMGYKLLKHGLVAAEIARLRSKLEKKSELSAERIYSELAKLAFSNVQELYDDHGNLIPINELPPDVAAVISSIDDTGKGGKKLKLHSKIAALELGSKLLGMIRQEQQNQQAVTIILGPPPELPARPDNAQLRPEW